MMYTLDAMPVRPPSSRPVAAQPPDDQATYTIDELAALTSVPSRTIRFYQAKGALMSPTIRGRVAFYEERHVERLKLIAQLQERGLRIDAIRRLAQSIDRGELDLAEWLGVEQELTTSWEHDQARTMTESELLELAGSKRPTLIADLLRVKLIERRGDVYLVASPALLTIAMKLEAAGLDQETIASAGEILQKHLKRALSELSELLLARVRDGSLTVSQPSKLFETLRPVAIDAVRVLFAKQAERALRSLVESGALAALRPRRRTRRGR